MSTFESIVAKINGAEVCCKWKSVTQITLDDSLKADITLFMLYINMSLMYLQSLIS